jgi:phosphatidate cytidylyltransferase
MLYQRILTAIPLAVFVFWMIFFQPTSVFSYFIFFVILIAGYEWARLSGVANAAIRIIYAIVITAITWGLHKYASDYLAWVIYFSVLWWLAVTYYLTSAKPKAANSNLKLDKLFIAFIVLPAAALAMQKIHGFTQGAAWLFYALSLVWVADIGAYFSGKNFGKNKLAPAISPGKTKEGLYGAVLATSLYTLAASYYFEFSLTQSALLILLSVILTFVSVSGDLYISLLKREIGLKDTGHILPGHGGILDRIDSVLAAMPVFIVGCDFLIFPDML